MPASIARWALLGAAALLGCRGGTDAPPPALPPPPPPSPGVIQLTSATYAVAEGGGPVEVQVTRTGGSSGAVSVELATADGSATAPDDYAGAVVAVAFADGDSAPKLATIAIVDDADHEPTESFAVALRAVAGGATLGAQASATISIADDDPEPPPPVVPPPARPAARARSTADGSCDGLMDYGGEFRVAAVRVVGRTYPEPANAELDLELDLQNTGGARFRSASVLPDLSGAADLGVRQSPPPLPADFAELSPGGRATSTAPLRLRLPFAREAELLARLESGALPLRVDADEENVHAADVRVLYWTPTEDGMYHAALTNSDPGPGPFAPRQELGIGLLDPLFEVSTVLDQWVPGTATYLLEDPASPTGPLVYLPPVLRKVRILEATKLAPAPGNEGYTAWSLRVRVTNDEPLPEIFTTASHCTGQKAHVDRPVQASRVSQLDNDTVPDAERDGNGQPLRMNEMVFSEGAITFSGQIAGHVLKPSLSIRLRHGQVELGADFENDVSFTGELRAERTATLTPAPAVLWQLCFPVPPLSIWPFAETPMSVRLVHEMDMKGSVGAGARMSLSKHFVSGVAMRCQSGLGQPSSCTAESYRRGTPPLLTPPQLTESTGFELRPETTFRALLRIGDDACATGPGISLDASAYGRIGLSPADDPWWSLAYGVELKGAVDMAILGLDVSRFETQLYASEDAATTSAMFPASADPVGQRRSGDDQRWSVAIDDTSVPNGVNQSRIAVLPDGSSLVVATEPVGGRNPLVKLDRHGALVWVKELARKVLRIHALPDGSAVLVGSTAWLARVDADGKLLWSHEAELTRTGLAFTRCVLSDVAALEQAPGVYDYVGVGAMGTALVTTVDSCAFRVRDDGTLAWSRIYVGDRGQHFEAAIATRDGQVVAVGSDHWAFVGNRTVPLIAKIDAGSGDLLWAKKLPMTRLAALHDVAEAADGTIYAAGGAQGILSSTGAALLARIAGDGSDARHALYFEDADWEARLDAAWSGLFSYAPWVDTAGGNTAYDAFFGIAPSGDGLVAVGTTGLGSGTAGRAVKVNAKLGVEWMAVFDGPSTDGLTGVATAAEGLLVSGYSASLPQANGGSGDNQAWVMKLPLTGTIAFLPSAPVTVRYSSPGVRASGTDAGVNPTADAAIDALLTYEEPIVVSSGPNAGLLVSASPYCVELLTPTGQVGTADLCPDP